MVGEDEQFLPDLDRELKSFIRGERNGNKDEYSETTGEHGLPDSFVPLFCALCVWRIPPLPRSCILILKLATLLCSRPSGSSG